VVVRRKELEDYVSWSLEACDAELTAPRPSPTHSTKRRGVAILAKGGYHPSIRRVRDKQD
jgi:hypothetical protein